MVQSIYPSETSAVSGAGVLGTKPTRQMREFQLTEYFSIRCLSPAPSFVHLGFDVTAGTGLQVNVAAGTAIIESYLVRDTAASSIGSLTDTDDNFIYLQLTITSSLATSFALTANTTGVTPAHSVLLAKATASGGSITAISNSPKDPRYNNANWVGDGGPTEFFMGFRPVNVEVFWNDSDSGHSDGHYNHAANSIWYAHKNYCYDQYVVNYLYCYPGSHLTITDYGFTVGTGLHGDNSTYYAVAQA